MNVQEHPKNIPPELPKLIKELAKNSPNSVKVAPILNQILKCIPLSKSAQPSARNEDIFQLFTETKFYDLLASYFDTSIGPNMVQAFGVLNSLVSNGYIDIATTARLFLRGLFHAVSTYSSAKSEHDAVNFISIVFNMIIYLLRATPKCRDFQRRFIYDIFVHKDSIRDVQQMVHRHFQYLSLLSHHYASVSQKNLPNNKGKRQGKQGKTAKQNDIKLSASFTDERLLPDMKTAVLQLIVPLCHFISHFITLIAPRDQLLATIVEIVYQLQFYIYYDSRIQEVYLPILLFVLKASMLEQFPLTRAEALRDNWAFQILSRAIITAHSEIPTLALACIRKIFSDKTTKTPPMELVKSIFGSKIFPILLSSDEKQQEQHYNDLIQWSDTIKSKDDIFRKETKRQIYRPNPPSNGDAFQPYRYQSRTDYLSTCWLVSSSLACATPHHGLTKTDQYAKRDVKTVNFEPYQPFLKMLVEYDVFAFLSRMVLAHPDDHHLCNAAWDLLQEDIVRRVLFKELDAKVIELSHRNTAATNQYKEILNDYYKQCEALFRDFCANMSYSPSEADLVAAIRRHNIQNRTKIKESHSIDSDNDEDSEDSEVDNTTTTQPDDEITPSSDKAVTLYLQQQHLTCTFPEPPTPPLPEALSPADITSPIFTPSYFKLLYILAQHTQFSSYESPEAMMSDVSSCLSFAITFFHHCTVKYGEHHPHIVSSLVSETYQPMLFGICSNIHAETGEHNVLDTLMTVIVQLRVLFIRTWFYVKFGVNLASKVIQAVNSNDFMKLIHEYVSREQRLSATRPLPSLPLSMRSPTGNVDASTQTDASCDSHGERTSPAPAPTSTPTPMAKQKQKQDPRGLDDAMYPDTMATVEQKYMYDLITLQHPLPTQLVIQTLLMRNNEVFDYFISNDLTERTQKPHELLKKMYYEELSPTDQAALKMLTLTANEPPKKDRGALAPGRQTTPKNPLQARAPKRKPSFEEELIAYLIPASDEVGLSSVSSADRKDDSNTPVSPLTLGDMQLSTAEQIQIQEDIEDFARVYLFPYTSSLEEDDQQPSPSSSLETSSTTSQEHDNHDASPLSLYSCDNTPASTPSNAVILPKELPNDPEGILSPQEYFFYQRIQKSIAQQKQRLSTSSSCTTPEGSSSAGSKAAKAIQVEEQLLALQLERIHLQRQSFIRDQVQKRRAQNPLAPYLQNVKTGHNLINDAEMPQEDFALYSLVQQSLEADVVPPTKEEMKRRIAFFRRQIELGKNPSHPSKTGQNPSQSRNHLQQDNPRRRLPPRPQGMPPLSSMPPRKISLSSKQQHINSKKDGGSSQSKHTDAPPAPPSAAYPPVHPSELTTRDFSDRSLEEQEHILKQILFHFRMMSYEDLVPKYKLMSQEELFKLRRFFQLCLRRPSITFNERRQQLLATCYLPFIERFIRENKQLGSQSNPPS